MLTVNENTTAYLTVSFRDKNNVLAIPSSVTYRIDCVTTDAVVLASTSLTPATEIEITLTPAQNAILGTAAAEQKRVTVIAVYGASDQLTAQFDYQVINLSGVT